MKSLLKYQPIAWLYVAYLLIIAPFKWLFKAIANRVYKFRLELKVKEALRLAKLENRRYIVTAFFGKPICVPKQNIKELLHQRKFRKGVTIAHIEKSAYFITK